MTTQTVATDFANHAPPIDLVALGGSVCKSVQVVIDDVPSSQSQYAFTISFEIVKLAIPQVVSYALPYSVTLNGDFLFAFGSRNDPGALSLSVTRRSMMGYRRDGVDASVLAALDAKANLDELAIQNLRSTLTINIPATRVLGGVGSMHLVVTW